MSRDRVYELLAGEPERFRSGERSAGRWGSAGPPCGRRWDSLRREGYGIEAHTGLGYRLVAAPDALTERGDPPVSDGPPARTCGAFRRSTPPTPT